jgi:mannose-6-phosphate isomerase-like protein (cupin superfamily)
MSVGERVHDCRNPPSSAVSIKVDRDFSENESVSRWQVCDGWYLVKDDEMTIIHERMPPGTAESLHKHTRARQFFFVLTGLAVMEHGGEVTTLGPGTGLEVPPGVPHRIQNAGDADLEILVTSVPPSHADRAAVDA